MTATEQPTTQVFISYSHKDKEWLDRLNVHMAPIKRNHSFAIWDDTTIKPGMKWDDEIKEALGSVRAAVLLISADFLASEYIYNEELPRILEAAAQKGAVILSVIVSPCLLSSVPALAQIQSVNDPKTPLIKMRGSQREELFVKVASQVMEILSKVPAKEPVRMATNGGTRSVKQAASPKKQDTSLRQIKKQIQIFAANDNDGRFLVVSVGDVYVQYAHTGGEILFEAVSNKFLPKEQKLSPDQQEGLLQLGFAAPDENSPNYYMGFVLPNEEAEQELADVTASVFFDVHGLPRDATLSFEHGVTDF